MLQSLRSAVGSWVVKILFALLILSFAVWGIGDMFRGAGPATTVAEVGPVEVSRAELDQEFRRQMDRLRPLFGGGLTAEQARQFGLLDQAVSSIVQRTLFDLAATDAGVQVGDEAIRRHIAQEPAFQNPPGRFDPLLFQQVLRANNMTEQGYVAILRQEIGRSLVVGAVASAAAAPRPLVESLYRHRAERRVAELVTIPHASVGEVGTPDDETVRRHYEEHPIRFTAPEYRALTVAALSVDDVGRELTVAEDELRAYFEDHAHEYRTPERRDVGLVVVDDEARAREIAEGARTAGFAEAARVAGTEPVTLDGVARGDLPELGDAAFALRQGEVSEPVRSGLGWHVLTVTAIQPGDTRGFEEMRDEILARMRRDRGFDMIYEVSNRIDDALAAGTALEELAQREGMTLTRVPAVDASGQAPDGTPVTGLPGGQRVLQTGFTMPAGQTSGLLEVRDDTFVVARVDGVTPPALRPLDEVRGQVVAEWRQAERERLSAERAAEVAAALRAGAEASAQRIAEEAGGSFAMTAPFTRDARAVEGLTPELVNRLFAAEPDGVVAGTTADAQVVARLREILPADPTAPDAVLAPVEETVARGVESDLIAQFTQALQARYPVQVHQGRIEQMYASPN